MDCGDAYMFAQTMSKLPGGSVVRGDYALAKLDDRISELEMQAAVPTESGAAPSQSWTAPNAPSAFQRA